MSLVSIVVLTYNSSRTIIDTLNSIVGQGYRDIELIITDDCSTDDTVNVVKKWITQYRDVFKCVQIIETPKNKGVTANVSRGVYSSCGEWVKVLAGDDMLNHNAIERFISVASTVGGDFFFSGMELFNDDTSKEVPSAAVAFYDEAYAILKQNFSAEEQYDIMRYSSNFCPAPGSFFSRKAFDSLGGFDLSIAMAEDMPIWLKATERGYKLNFIDEALVRYRIGDGSVQRSGRFIVTRRLIKYKYLLNMNGFGIYKHIKQLDGYDSLLNKVFFILLKLISIPSMYAFRKKAVVVSQKYGVKIRKIAIL